MQPKTLRVRASGDVLVQNHERLELGVNEFVGRKYTQLESGQWAFKPTDEVVELPSRAEYLKDLKEGHLVAADEATANAAGVPFDASRAGAPPRLPDENESASQAFFGHDGGHQ